MISLQNSKFWIWLLLGLGLGISHASAQQVVKLCVQVTDNSSGAQHQSCAPVTAANPLPIAGSFSATVGITGLTSSNLSGTIAVSNTFQSIQASTAGRNGCLLQNNGTNPMWVFFGALGSATKGASFVLAAGASLTCAVGGLGVVTDQISITGTAGDAFFANFQ